MALLVGSDPELFVQAADGTIVSGIGKIGGSKEAPKLVKSGAVQEDNVLAEFNIDPAATLQEFLDNLSTVTGELNAILEPQGLSTVCKTSHKFEQEYLVSEGDNALMFGCDPDYNCWTRSVNDSPSPYTVLRTAGGHVHVGYDMPDEDRSYEIACILDYILGVPSVLLDSDTDRRSMYGQAGACRLKAYGVEYRVLSNFWLGSETLKTWVYEMTTLVSGLKLEELSEVASPESVIEAINSSNTEMAKEIVGSLSAIVEGFYLPEEVK